MYRNNLEFAEEADRNDPLSAFRDKFYIPRQENGKEFVYMCGNSLGLQPKSTRELINQELEDWKLWGVEGHFKAKHPWMPYHEFLTSSMARVVGAKEHEVVVMNTLTVNLHLMMVSFYRPKGRRRKVLIEFDAFPSDKFAVASQLRFHDLDPDECMIQLKAREGEDCLRPEDILSAIEEAGEELALVMLGNTNYYTGQFFNMKTISEAAHKAGALVGFDCAHGAGNVELKLHESGCDFAVWCSYKYLNSGPGSIAGCFVHERHAADNTIKRFEGWWGHNKETRFGMRDDFDPIYGVEAWQLSNPPVLSMAAVWASLRIFDEAGISSLRKKSVHLTAYLEYLVQAMEDERVEIITPGVPEQRGCQLSIRIKSVGKLVYDSLYDAGVIADWREPDVIRVAPAPLYTSYRDVYEFVKILEKQLSELS
jgi:kynureninase